MEQQVIPSDYTQYAEAVEIIKHAIERCRYRSAAAVNKETLSLYFGVGKFVSENSRIGCWGTKHCYHIKAPSTGVARSARLF